MSATSTGPSPILSAFALEKTGESEYRGPSVGDEHRPVVFGGQIMGQMIVAASLSHPGKRVKSLHLIFARAGTTELPVDISIRGVHSGRSFASSSAVARQGDRVLSEGLILLDAGDEDVIRHGPAMPGVAAPEESPEVASAEPGVELRIVDGVDLGTTAATGPAELDAWVRFSGVPADPAVHQALLSWYTDGFLIGAAMRPHEGVGQEQAHRSLSTGVIAHTLTFHEPAVADEWMLISNRSLHAGSGRAYGEGHVFARDGQLLASFVQESMIRRFDQGASGPGTSSPAM
jgi:acyl-CoA thioesterase II